MTIPEPRTVAHHAEQVAVAVGDADLVASVQRARGFVGSAESITRMAQVGVTTAVVDTLAALAGWAVGQGTQFARSMQDGEPVHDVYLVLEGDLTDLLRDHGRDGKRTDLFAEYAVDPVATVLAWAIVEAGSPDEVFLSEECPARNQWTEGEAEATRRWLSLGSIGALAWAAGVTLDETVERTATDTDPVRSLMALAGLRGWRFPPAEHLPW